ncbi:non-ribosomal peptide synthetase [Sporomusa sp. KB1]|uniref:non-ribosomal peptide synthetase n=1 Tax=Sporomusa sp. KB1 TaxID=943346 RepID=UPI0011ABCC5B|nr:non-ribosomal peptide synthetase [Sporomusa sp. KB1]TWH51680.1 non-ribosomal peptide synthase protein (TIGR01720 family)/amino acid adenylation domain-containing protein [Sporomusa sp. KB1]
MKKPVCYPLSHPQQRIWSTEMMLPETSFANICASMLLKKSNINLELLTKAINLAIQHNEALRIRLIQSDSGVQQYVAEYQEIDLDVIQGPGLSEWFKKQSQTPLALLDAPLAYFALVKYSEESYGFYIKLHHVISDGFSFSILNKQIVEYYEKLESGRDIEAIAKPSFTDYFAREEEYLVSQQCTQDREYWLQRLDNLPEPLTMQFSSTKTGIAATRRIFGVAEELQNKIDQFCREQETTLFRFMMSVLYMYLARVYRSNDIIIGTAYFNRVNRKELNTIGMYVSTIPLRIAVDGESTFADLLSLVHCQLMEDMAHQQYPYNLLAQDLRARGQTPDGLLNINVVQIPNAKADKFVTKEWYQGADPALLNMVINPNQLPKGSPLEIALDYRNDLFNAAAIERLFAGLLALIQDLLDNPQKQLFQLEIMPEAEKQQLLVEFNKAQLPVPDKTFIELFQEQVDKTPENIAVLDFQQSLTYAELDKVTDSLAARLQNLGVVPDTVVGIMVPRTADFVIGTLAIMKAGGAYLPISADYPDGRIQYMIADSKIPVLLGVEQFKAKTVGFQGTFIDMGMPGLFDYPVQNLAKVNRPSDLAYIIYTSGSTGNPKGVMISHANLIHLCIWHNSQYQTTPDDISALYFNTSFDASVKQIFPFLIEGGAVLIIPEELLQDITGLNKYIVEKKVTFIGLPTQFAETFMASCDNSILKYMIVGGEKLRSYKPRGYQLINEYGPTEFTVCATYYLVQQQLDNIPIGKPVANSWAYILDQADALQPLGVPGELCLAGPQIARGYLGRPDLTNEKFIDNPFQTCGKNAKLYRTGDLACWNEQGELIYLGRMDNQVKLRGFRIELGEIESAMTTFDGITEGVAEVKEIGKVQHLCGYFTANMEIDINQLREHLSQSLAEYMVPTAFMQLDKIPLTPNGKVDKKALPTPVIERQERVLPQTESQQQLFNLVANLLGTDDFGITDDLFHVGMTSMLAIKMSTAIYQQFNSNIKTIDIINNKTIEKLAAILQTTVQAEAAVFAKREFYPLTENQRGLYYEWEKERAALQYNIPEVIKFSNKVDPHKLQTAVEKVIEAHPYLKTCLGTQEGQVVQLRQDGQPVAIRVAKASEAEIESIKAAFVQPFDLFAGPLYRIAIYYTENYTYLFMDIHHIIVDGSAIGVFTTDLVTAYNGAELQQESYTAFEYALEEEQLAGSEKYLVAEKFFDNKLSGNMTELPQTSKGEGTGQAEVVVVNVPGQKLMEFCKEHAVTPSNLFLAALCNTLTRYTREERIAITTISSGRNESKLIGIMGMFVRTLPVVVQINPGETAVACVKAIQENTFTTLANELYPFTKMVEKHKIVPQINYVYQGGVLDTVELAGQPLEPEGLALNKAKFPVSIVVGLKNDEYELSIDYDGSLYTKAYIEGLSSAIAECVNQIAENPEQSCGKLAIISKETEQKLLNDFRGRSVAYDRQATFLDLFKKQVEKNASNIALVDEQSSFTYGQTDGYTDCLAKELVRLGVTANTFVGIMLPRRKEFMVSVIGTMKAGGAYVPLDNEYPQERIEYMLEDSKAKVLITERSIYQQKGMQVDNVIFIDEFDFATASNQDIQLTVPTTENLAYMIYTSGSTGKPKGVMIRHKSLAAFLAWRTRDYQLTAKDNLCCHSSFSFDASVEDLFTALSVGGQLHIISEELRQNMHGLHQYFHANHITGGTFSTQFGMELLNQFDLSLRYIIMGGEKLKQVKKTNIKMVNGYGPTEFTICSSYHVVDQEKDSGNIPIGKPVANSWAYVVDKNNNLMPIGVAGELCMSGSQLALGYWNREELTKEKFIDNPFKTCEENAKLYRTGDLVCWNENGELEYVGRIDNQVKLRGFRIELGEVENAMAKFAGITASVAEIKEIGKVQHLCGYFTTNKTVNTEELKEHLAASLTGYMVPSFLMQLDSLPLTPNGKVDRKALPLPEIHGSATYVAPHNETEAILASVFEMILGIEKIGIDDSFFALGGDSIKAIRMVSKLREQGVFVTVPIVMQGKTIRAISETAACQGTTPTIDQQAVAGEAPLTFIQAYFFAQNLPRPHHFNQSIMLESAQRVDETVLGQSLHALTAHHDMLRAVYRSAGRQEIRPVESEQLYSLTTYEYQEDNRWQSAMEVACNNMQAGFDLTSGPMLQAGLFRTPSIDMLFIVIHHLVVDGVSWRILIEDINTAYRQVMRSEQIALPPKTVSFKMWSEAIGRYRTSYAIKQEIPYWKKVQDSFSAGRIPAACSGETGLGNVSVAIDEEQTRALVSTASIAYHTEVNDLLLCALGRAVHKVTGQTTVSINLEGHGREPIGEHLPIDRTVGWFTSVYPIVLTDIGFDIRSDIRRVKETLRRVPNHGIGYGILQYIGETALDQQLQPDISFNYLGELSEEHTGALFAVNNQAPQGQAVYEGNTFGSPIALNGLVKDKQLLMDIGYDRTKYKDAMITQLGDAFAQELKLLIAHCVSHENIEITAADLGEIVWNDTEFEALLQQTKAKGWEIECIYPLTPMQEGMLFHRLAEPESTSYFLQNIFRLTKPLSVALLQKALYHLGQIHEVLRTAILYKGLSESRQAILKGRAFEVSQVDISGASDTSEQLEMLKQQDIQRGFDLQEDPLLRVTIVKISADNYCLIWSTHHIIIDGWCLSLVMNDFMNICNTLYAGQEYIAVGQPTRTRYEDHVRSLLAQNKEAAHTYWKNLLCGYSTDAAIHPLGIPTGGEEQESTVTYQFSKEITEQIQTVCSHYDVTINTAVEAAWGLVLQKYTNTGDVVFGKVVSGRNTGIAGAEEMVGLFINTIPVRVQTDKEETLGSLLQKLQQQAIESTRYDTCALSEVQQLSDAGSSLIRTIMAFENYHIAEPKIQQAAIDFIPEAVREQTNYGISVIAYLQESLTIGITYHTNTYGNAEIEQILAGMAAVLTENPTILCKDIAIISDEQLKTLECFNQTDTEYRSPCGSIVEMFKQQVRRVPNNIAVVYEQKQYTYQELDEITDKLAKKLKTVGVGAEQIVGVLIDRSEYMVIYPLAIIKAGGAYMPLDYSFPTDRLEFMIQDAGVQLILSEQNRVAEHLPQFSGTVITTADIATIEVDESITLTLPVPKDMFVILYTSGSTGTPKGCILENHNLANYCNWFQAYYRVTENDRAAGYANFGFDAHMLDIYPYITCGAATYIIPTAMRLDFIKLNQYFEENQLSIAFMTTQLGRQFVEEFDNTSLRALLVGGEKLLPIKKPAYDFYNVYGPTECTLFTTSYEIKNDYNSAIIGKPLANYQLYVLDTNLQLLPIGTAGELCIGGAGVGRGYLNREDITREKFIMWQGKRIYRTGDLVRWTKDGEIEYLGRMDGQVKLRGLRIELGEIESQILTYEGITSCAVVVKEIGGTQHLCGYYTAESNIDVEKLKEQLAAKLTTFMIPTAFTELAQLPLTSNGKVNRRALPDPVIERQERVLPQTESQQQLFDLVANLLGTEDFGITDDLFHVGMTSMLAIKMSVAIYQQFNLNIKTNDILQNKTIEKLAAILQTTAQAETIAAFAKRECYPLTENQRGLYYEWEKDRAALQYNIPEVIKFSNKVDPNKLQAAAEKVIEAHPYLKTCLGTKDGQVVQLRQDDKPVAIRVAKVSQAEIESIKAAFVQPFDLFAGPLYRIAIYYTENYTYLFVDIHHIIFDGSALGVFTADLVTAYNGAELQQESYTAFEYALEEEQLAESETYLAAEKFFDHMLSDSMTELPKVAKGEGEGQAELVVTNIPGQGITNFCKENAVTPSSVFLAALCNTLTRYTREERIAITTISSGRSENKLNGIMGMFVKTLPVVVQINPGETVAACVKAVQENMYATLANEIYPFTKMVEKHKIVPQINYAYQGGLFDTAILEGQALETEILALNKVKFPLAIDVSLKNEEYQLVIEYDESLYTKAYIATLSSALAEFAQQIAKNPQLLCKDISLVNEKQRQLLASFIPASEDYADQTLQELFEKAAAANDEKPALIAIDKTLSYAALNTAANKIANALIAKGIKPEDKVAFLLPRDSRLICTIFGIIKSGGAFIPVDPEYPADRIKHVLEDSEAQYIITTESKQATHQFSNGLVVDELLQNKNEANPQTEATAKNLCYIIYTSGSTGKPKGVMIEHRNIVNYVLPLKSNFYINKIVTTCSTMLSVTTVAFDVFLEEALVTLANGLTLVFADEDRANNPMLLAEFITENGVDVMSTTPSRIMQYIEAGAFAKALGKIKLIICGGEKFPVNFFTALRKYTAALIYNTYGPTETTIATNAKELENEEITIGKALSNVALYVVDKELNVLPIGVVGELLIGGKGVGRGYLNRQDLTDEKFIQFKGERVYKSGDYAKWTAAGEIDIMGRMDDQIKLRGLRIELGEIESRMNEYAGITASVVTIKQLQNADYLCAYFTAKDKIDISDLREYLKRQLTAYMVPTTFTQLDKMPVTPNGKMDVKALPTPEIKNYNEYVAPTNEVEEQLCHIFAETLTLDKVGITDSFFDLGGTSLQAMNVVVKAMALDIGITYANVFKHQTPQKLAEFLTNNVEEAVTTDVSAYDYSAIDKLLAKNTLSEITETPIGDILLAGATGFLGIHILKEFLENYPGKVYCLIRSKDNIASDTRLKVRLVYYFDNEYAELFGKRIFTVEGDITELAASQVTVDTVINCAANVKHFAAGDELEKVNVGGVQKLIQYCLDNKAQLIQVSTTSVSGTGDAAMKDCKIKESQLYLGQTLDNKYIYSKFLAERCVLEAIVDKGLKAKIMRVGNLMSRNTDGEFQINFQGNSFMNSLKSFKLLGKFPVAFMGGAEEFSPIDSTAKAIVKLAQTNKEYTVFHPCNNHAIYMSDIIYAMKEYGFAIDIVSDREFAECLKEKMQEAKLMPALTGILAYQENSTEKPVYGLGRTNEFTTEVLYRLNFKWPLTSEVYIKKAIEALDGLGFFDTEY